MSIVPKIQCTMKSGNDKILIVPEIQRTMKSGNDKFPFSSAVLSNFPLSLMIKNMKAFVTWTSDT